MYKKAITFMIIPILFIGCDRRDCANIDFTIHAQITIPSGSDYLAQFSDAALQDSLRIYTLENDVLTTVQNPGENAIFTIISDTSVPKIVRIYLTPTSATISDNVIEFPDGNMDTISFRKSQGKCLITYTDLRWNSKEVTPDNAGIYHLITE